MLVHPVHSFFRRNFKTVLGIPVLERVPTQSLLKTHNIGAKPYASREKWLESKWTLRLPQNSRLPRAQS